MKSKKQTAKLDILNGSIWNKIPLYALPVAATGILEQLFNASDIAIVGNFSSTDRTVAIAAVGANSPVIGVILIPILAGLSQFVFSKLTMKTQPQADAAGGASMKSMMYMMPLFSVYIAFIMPAALGVYWIAQSVFSLIQEAVLNKTLSAKMEAEEEARFQARQADRQRRMEEARVQEQQRKQEEQKKKTLREKQQAAQAAKAVKAAKAATSTTEAGRVGDRPYARGRAYKADRYDET